MLMNKHIYIVIVVVLLGLLGGCADSHNIIRQSTESLVPISPRDSFYISLSRDGVYGNEAYLGSGLTLSEVILSSFAKYARHVDVATTVEPYEEVLKTARTKKYDYLVYPTILHWENHATEWNALPKKVKVKIDVIKVDDDSLFNSVIIEGKSGLAIFGDGKPQDLLPGPIDEFVSSMFKIANQRVQH